MTLRAVSTVAATRPLQRAASGVRVSIVIPCLNEAENIAECVQRAQMVLAEHRLVGEILVVDNGSDDGSGHIARAVGAKVIDEPRRGYGQAYLAGFREARGRYIVMIDADLTYDFEEIPRFIHALDDGAEVVIGNRLRGVEPGAMSVVSRIGNPLLSGFLNLLYRTPIADAHCGMRAFRRSALTKLKLQATGMELASEMVIRASHAKLEMRELPIALHPRGGESKLVPLRDGWRHLRLMLVYRPQFLFIIPGLITVLAGLLIDAAVISGATILGRAFYIHAEIGATLLINVGVEVVTFGLIARTYGVFFMGIRDPLLERLGARFKLEHGLLIGGALILAGLVGGAVIVGKWLAAGAGTFGESEMALLAATGLVAGVQIFFASFVLSILGLRRPRRAVRR